MWNYIVFGLLGFGIGVLFGMYFTKEKNKVNNMKSYNQGWHDCTEWDKEYSKKIDEFNSDEGE